MYFHRSGHCNLSNCKLTRQKNFGTSTGFEAMASALASLATKNHTLGAGQFVEFILTHEWNEAMKMMQTGENTNFKCRYDRRSGYCNL